MHEKDDPILVQFPPEVVLECGLRTFSESQKTGNDDLIHKATEILKEAQQLPLARYFQHAIKLKIVDKEDPEKIQQHLIELLKAILDIFSEFDFHRLSLTSFYSSVMEILEEAAEKLEFFEIQPVQTPAEVTLTKIVDLINEILAKDLPKDKLNTLYNYLQALLSS